MILSHKHRINIVPKIYCCRRTTGRSFRSFLKFFMHGFRLFRKLLHSNIFFSLFFFLESKLENKTVDQILGYILGFCPEIRAHLGHYFAWTPKIIKFDRWPCSKLFNYCVKSAFVRWNQECKQKQSCIFNFCKILDLFTWRIQKIVWRPQVFKPDFHIFPYNKQIRKT